MILLRGGRRGTITRGVNGKGNSDNATRSYNETEFRAFVFIYWGSIAFMVVVALITIPVRALSEMIGIVIGLSALGIGTLGIFYSSIRYGMSMELTRLQWSLLAVSLIFCDLFLPFVLLCGVALRAKRLQDQSERWRSYG